MTAVSEGREPPKVIQPSCGQGQGPTLHWGAEDSMPGSCLELQPENYATGAPGPMPEAPPTPRTLPTRLYFLYTFINNSLGLSCSLFIPAKEVQVSVA